MVFTPPSVADFKAYYVRDFPYGSLTTQVMDADITNAIADVAYNFNIALFPDQTTYTLGYLCLSAHFLVQNLQASSQGIAGSYNWLSVGKGAGSVNDSYAIPQQILDNPLLAMYSRTRYGMKFLELILPQLAGQYFSSCSRTKP